MPVDNSSRVAYVDKGSHTSVVCVFVRERLYHTHDATLVAEAFIQRKFIDRFSEMTTMLGTSAQVS